MGKKAAPGTFTVQRVCSIYSLENRVSSNVAWFSGLQEAEKLSSKMAG